MILNFKYQEKYSAMLLVHEIEQHSSSSNISEFTIDPFFHAVCLRA